MEMEIWSTEVLYMFTLSQVCTMIGTGCGLYSLVKPDGTIDRIFTGGAGRNGATVAGTSVLSPASPLLLVIVAAWMLAYKSEELIFHNQPLAYITLFCLIFAKITNRLVVAHMCKGEITHRDAALLAPLGLFLNQYFNTFITEWFLLYLALVWVILDLAWYCTQVCQEICVALKVELFTIPYPPPTVSDRQNGSSQTSGVTTRNRKQNIKK